jgi:hypothetical protein
MLSPVHHITLYLTSFVVASHIQPGFMEADIVTHSLRLDAYMGHRRPYLLSYCILWQRPLITSILVESTIVLLPDLPHPESLSFQSPEERGHLTQSCNLRLQD